MSKKNSIELLWSIPDNIDLDELENLIKEYHIGWNDTIGAEESRIVDLKLIFDFLNMKNELKKLYKANETLKIEKEFLLKKSGLKN